MGEVSEAWPQRPDLIFDIGVSDGMDAQFYLAKGFRVVGVEADPLVYTTLINRHQDAIASGRLTLINRAAHAISGERFRIYVHAQHQGLSGQAKRQDVPDNYYEFDVATVGWLELIQRFGMPRYAKIDIEGGEASFLRGMLESGAFPEFVSAECYRFEVVQTFIDMGYTRFVLVDQKPFQSGGGYRLPEVQREGAPLADFAFRHASGPFGLDVFSAGEVLDAQRVRAAWTAASKRFGETWCDCHAWRPATAART